MRTCSHALSALVATLSLVGCVGDPSLEETGHALAEIQVIPAGVGCLRVVYRVPGATADTTRGFAVTPRTSATLDLGVLAQGSYTFRAAAYNVACGSITTTTVPSWVGDPTSATVTQGYATSVAFTLRPNVSTSTTVDFIQPARAIFSGPTSYSTYAILQDGSVRAWGANDNRQLGGGDAQNALVPRPVVGIVGPEQIVASSNFACASTTSGGLYCWGNNAGAFPDPATPHTVFATPVAYAGPYITALAANAETFCVDDGTVVRCWGSDGVSAPGWTRSAQLALVPSPPPGTRGLFNLATDGTVHASTVADINGTDITFNRAAQSIAVGARHYCVLTVAGRVLCSGSNSEGALGVPTATDTPLGTEVDTGLSDVRALSSNLATTCALLSDRTVSCWGSNAFGMTGTGIESAVVRTPTALPITEVVQLAAGMYHTCALRADGTVWCWGFNGAGQLGDGTNRSRWTPVRVRL